MHVDDYLSFEGRPLCGRPYLPRSGSGSPPAERFGFTSRGAVRACLPRIGLVSLPAERFGFASCGVSGGLPAGLRLGFAFRGAASCAAEDRRRRGGEDGREKSFFCNLWLTGGVEKAARICYNYAYKRKIGRFDVREAEGIA